VQASDAAMHVYKEVIPFVEKNEPWVANAMRIGAKERAKKVLWKMGKLVAMANPIHGCKFLEKVHFVLNCEFLVFFCLCNLFILITKFYSIL